MKAAHATLKTLAKDVETLFSAAITGPVHTAFLIDHGDRFVRNFPPNSGPCVSVATLTGIGGFARDGCG